MNAHALPAAPMRKSRWIPWLFVLGFVVVVAVNGALVYFAVGSFTGLTTTEPYTKGLRFNDQIRHVEAQERLGWHLAARFQRAGALHGELELELKDRSGAPLAGARVTAKFGRPVERDRDFTVALQPAGGGRYVARVALPLPGAWDVRYRIERDGQDIEAQDRLTVE
ncbi:MAG: FixH family protein [Rhodospirillaceae bacterium]|nr:FixH family protein [Rhodospirillaceae bacterium]